MRNVTGSVNNSKTRVKSHSGSRGTRRGDSGTNRLVPTARNNRAGRRRMNNARSIRSRRAGDNNGSISLSRSVSGFFGDFTRQNRNRSRSRSGTNSIIQRRHISIRSRLILPRRAPMRRRPIRRRAARRPLGRRLPGASSSNSCFFW